MADNMCGPSNGAKNLLAHADRDRTLHQDRLVNAPQAGPGNSFRSQAPVANGAEMAFGSFQQGAAPMDPTFGPGLDMNAIHPAAPHPAPAGAYGHPAAGMPATMDNLGFSAPAARLNSPATGGVAHHEWVDQFAGMQLGADAAGPSAAMPNQAHPVGMAPVQRLPGLAPFAMPMHAGAHPAFPYGPQNPGMTAVAQQQPQAGLSHDAIAIDHEAFNRAFDEYEDDLFKKEVANWTKQSLADAEFEKEQDKWMAEHGPRAERGGKAGPPTAEETAEIDANLEKLAQEQEKRESDDALARAATDIVNSVADNQSDKFKNSRFFELMRRIGNREVAIEGDNFVDTNTGEKVNTSYEDHDNSDSGLGSDVTSPERINGRA
ncbi:hypothetical protein VTK56DRAFT_3880 [Thermocarpiscus australiensis]